jgi:hypothetical protein
MHRESWYERHFFCLLSSLVSVFVFVELGSLYLMLPHH